MEWFRTVLFPDLFKLVVRRARRHLEVGDVDAAIAAARRYARLRPKDPKGWSLWSEMLGKKDEVDDDLRERVLREGLRRNPKSRELMVAVGWIVGWTNQKALTPAREAEANRLFLSAMRRDASNPWTYLGLMRLAATQGRWQDVEKHGEEARKRIAVTEDITEFWSLVEGLLYVPGQARSLELVREAVAKEPAWAYPYLYIAALKNDDEAALLATAKKYWQPDRLQTFEEAIEFVKAKVAEAREWISETEASAWWISERDSEKHGPVNP